MPVRGRPFPKGQSGNPRGKPPGTKNSLTIVFEELADKHGGDVAKRLYHSALKGDMRAMKMVLDRQLPPPKDRPIRFDLPDIETAADLAKATGIVLKGVAAGELTPSEGVELTKLITAQAAAIEAGQWEARVAAMEKPPAARNDDEDSK